MNEVPNGKEGNISKSEKLDRTDIYQNGRIWVEITGKAIVKNDEDGTKTIELPVTVTDPDAPDEFKGEGRWSKYILNVDANGDIKWASRVDRRFDEKNNSIEFDGPRYQVHTGEINMLANTESVSKEIAAIRGENKYKINKTN